MYFLRLRQKAINYNDISQSARNKRLNSRNAVACLTARSLDYFVYQLNERQAVASPLNRPLSLLVYLATFVICNKAARVKQLQCTQRVQIRPSVLHI